MADSPDAEKKPPRKRSWANFSLRTLLIGVTLLCCYLGWETYAVRQRKEMLRVGQNSLYLEITKAADYAGRFPPGAKPKDVAGVWPLRRWLGDEAVQEIGFNPSLKDDPRLAAIRRWFPEAKFVESRPLEPCHPGCFPWGTLIETAKGKRSVEQIEVGDAILAIRRDGSVAEIRVSSIFRTRNRLVEVETEAGKLLTTPQQPLCVTSSKNIAAGELKPGERILVWRDGKPISTEVKQVTATERIEPVINLVLADSEAFIANGFVARSKPPLVGDSLRDSHSESKLHHHR